MDALPIKLSEIQYPITLWSELVASNWKDKEDATNFFNHLHHDLELVKFEMEKEKDPSDDHWDMNISIKSEDALFTFIHWLWPATRSIEAEKDSELWIVPIDDEGDHIVEMNCV